MYFILLSENEKQFLEYLHFLKKFQQI